MYLQNISLFSQVGTNAFDHVCLNGFNINLWTALVFVHYLVYHVQNVYLFKIEDETTRKLLSKIRLVNFSSSTSLKIIL